MSVLLLVVSLVPSPAPGTQSVLSTHCGRSPGVRAQFGSVQEGLKTR